MMVGYGVSITHGFFFSMGGFVSRRGRHPITTMEQLEDPLLGPAYISDILDVDAEDLMDRSKADALSKGLALLQGFWFIAQLIARFAQRLPTSELEIATLAYSVVNIFTWLLWWYKPLDVKRPILIGSAHAHYYLHQRNPKDAGPSSPSNSRHGLPAIQFGPSLGSLVGNAEMMPNGPSNDRRPHTTGINQQAAEARRLNEHYRASETFFRGPIQGDYTHYLPGASKYVPEFWSSPDVPKYSEFGAMFVGAVFGAIHCAAWNASFPSTAEMILWRTSAVLVAVYPASLLIPHQLGEILCPGHVHEHVPLVVQVVGISSYVAARLVLLVLAFSTLRAPAPEWFTAVDWTLHIPHLGISI
jgi:hypothetical protein